SWECQPPSAQEPNHGECNAVAGRRLPASGTDAAGAARLPGLRHAARGAAPHPHPDGGASRCRPADLPGLARGPIPVPAGGLSPEVLHPAAGRSGPLCAHRPPPAAECDRRVPAGAGAAARGGGRVPDAVAHPHRQVERAALAPGQRAQLLKHYGQSLPEADRKELNRLRFYLLACPEKQQRLGPRAQAALARAWELVADSVVAEAIQLRNDLRAVLNTSTTREEARAQFEQLRQSWPARFQPWTWRPGTPLEPPRAPETEGTSGLREYLEAIMAFFIRHFELMITYLGQPGVPRTNNHAERANRRYRALARP